MPEFPLPPKNNPAFHYVFQVRIFKEVSNIHKNLQHKGAWYQFPGV